MSQQPAIGRFIVFEGGEGAGKSTQARLLAQALAARGIRAVLTREPGGTPGAEAIRNLLLSTQGEGWGARAEALLFAAARADHVERLIRPTLARGEWVICDRFIDSSRAYQGGGNGLSDADVMTLHAIGSEGRRFAVRCATRDNQTASAGATRSITRAWRRRSIALPQRSPSALPASRRSARLKRFPRAFWRRSHRGCRPDADRP
jgi:hypothetical protein